MRAVDRLVIDRVDDSAPLPAFAGEVASVDDVAAVSPRARRR